MADCVGKAIEMIMNFVDTDYSNLIYKGSQTHSNNYMHGGDYGRISVNSGRGRGSGGKGRQRQAHSKKAA